MDKNNIRERQNFLQACQAVIQQKGLPGWPQLALKLGINPIQMQAARNGQLEEIPAAWISSLVKKYRANPMYLYFSEGSPLLQFKNEMQ